ncbi:MAG: hypothetical protein Q9180_009103, partial [Flavoplaca navasiana]
KTLPGLGKMLRSDLIEFVRLLHFRFETERSQVEKLHNPISEASGYVAVADDSRGKRGYGNILMLPITILTPHRLVDVGVTEVWDPGFDEFMKNAYHYHPKNNDHNSGDPIGISVCQLSACEGHRVTASGAYLASTPPNLTIMTNATVTKLVFKGKSVIGVETNGRPRRACTTLSIVPEMLTQG